MDWLQWKVTDSDHDPGSPEKTIASCEKLDEEDANSRMQEDLGILGDVLHEPSLVDKWASSCNPTSAEVQGFRELAEQSVLMGIDYATLGLSWDHPETRMEYREAQHQSTTCPASRERAERSRLLLTSLLRSLVGSEGKMQPSIGVSVRLLAEKSESGQEEPRGTIIALERGFWWVKLQDRGGLTEPRLVEASDLQVLSGAGADGLAGLIAIFCEETSAHFNARMKATGSAVLQALAAELLLPLRALNEDRVAGCTMARTYNGELLPKQKILACIDEITLHVLDGSYSSWRYENPIGAHQLEGLTAKQQAQWMDPSRSEGAQEGLTTGIVVHEDAPGELGLFWATKIGGPSHGFDYEGQCLLPLLANARHKVVLVSDAEWPQHPVGRAHFRLLWDADCTPPKPVLWLEALNADFGVAPFVPPERRIAWQIAVVQHVVNKAQDMGTMLSVPIPLGQDLLVRLVEEKSCRVKEQRLILRPSNAVVEASDYLSPRHDWLQLSEETTAKIARVVYEPTCTSPGASDLRWSEVKDDAELLSPKSF